MTLTKTARIVLVIVGILVLLVASTWFFAGSPGDIEGGPTTGHDGTVHYAGQDPGP
jgi:hypothetical protein